MPLKGRFFPPRDKIAENFNYSREKAGEGHVPPVITIFPRGGLSSPRYKLMSPMNKFTSLKDMVGNEPIF